MTDPAGGKNRRILVIDDNRAIHDDFRKILAPGTLASAALDASEAELFGELETAPGKARYEIDSAFQGQEGLAKVKQAHAAGQPYAMAFVDVRMPPGWDGVETTRRIWELDPHIQIVLCTAYSDYSWDEMFEKIGDADGLLILKKPFDTIEALQLAHALTEKWWLHQQFRQTIEDLENRVIDRTRKLQESQALLRIAGNIARIGGWTIDLPEVRVTWSDEVCAIHDMPAGTVPEIGEAAAFFIPHSREIITRAFDACVRAGIPFDLELEMNTATGRRVWVRSIGEALRDSEGGIIRLQGAFQDITLQKNLEQQFFRARRMESIGTLAGGIAHDLNNVLAPIMMSIELLTHQEQDPSRLGILSIIGGSAKRGADLIDQVMSFARGVDGGQTLLQPEILLAEMAELARETFPERVVIQSSIPENLWPVKGDAIQLHQMLLNLCDNARDAMPEGGTLSLSATNLEPSVLATGLHADIQPGRFVLLRVEDTGVGMPPEVIDRIFDPFFTTRGVGNGTGLGLSISLAIVRSHGGFIQVSSEPGKGTRFNVHLPAADGDH